jgi:hypothetical protein
MISWDAMIKRTRRPWVAVVLSLLVAGFTLAPSLTASVAAPSTPLASPIGRAAASGL